MLAQWMLVTLIILFTCYMAVRTFFYRSVAKKQEKYTASMKLTLQEAEVLIQKYQLQLQRSLGNIDILTHEMNALKDELKVLKQRNAQYRLETDKYKSRIRELEQKIEALL
ncbi:hypothetical protein [Helicobacter suis]|uniref:hypothetical protein n=1 Tax=Helicobacter suis TaxID=104628 RepID=UPI0024909B59|nr:hypothetical protein [Helicobacter suis]